MNSRSMDRAMTDGNCVECISANMIEQDDLQSDDGP